MSRRQRTKRCRNCPDEQPQPVQKAAAKASAKLTGRTLDQSLVTSQGESQKLWNHVLYGTSTCVGMIEGYAKLGLPGDPLPQLRSLSERLQKLIQSLEAPNAN